MKSAASFVACIVLSLSLLHAALAAPADVERDLTGHGLESLTERTDHTYHKIRDDVQVDDLTKRNEDGFKERGVVSPSDSEDGVVSLS